MRTLANLSIFRWNFEREVTYITIDKRMLSIRIFHGDISQLY